MNLTDIAKQFDISGSIRNIETFGSGHIHKTYRLNLNSGSSLILQKLNTYVFRWPVELMENAIRISEHLNGKRKEGVIDWEIIQFIPLKNEEYLFRDESGGYWRLFNFIFHSKIDRSHSELYFKAGNAYGTFIELLKDLPLPPLFETIPDFHNLYFRLEEFDIAVNEGQRKRKQRALSEVDQILREKENALRIPELVSKGILPGRITHNDTKIDNILFNRKMEVVSVIDLDTVMPGIVHSDFGDAMRTFGSTSDEDEIDISKVHLDMEIFTQFSKGFLNSLKNSLNEIELETLVLAPSLFAYMQAVRFLTDYLNNDAYYKTAYEDHNLIRTRNQLALLNSMNNQEDTMKKVLKKIIY